MPLIEREQIIAIVGICKNAGKTSVLNAILREYHAIGWAVLSTGRDGEERDTVFGIRKPRVVVKAGTMMCLDTQELDRHGAGIRIFAKLPWKSGTRQLWLAEAILPLETEIIGPPEVSQQAECARLMLDLGAEKVLIDGSIDRKSIALSPMVDALILVAGASYGNLKQLMAELERVELLTRIPVALPSRSPRALNLEHICLLQNMHWRDTGLQSILGEEKGIAEKLREYPDVVAVYIPGAVTERSISCLMGLLQNDGHILLLRHPYHLKIGKDEIERLLHRDQLMALNPFRIKAIALNSRAVDGRHLDAMSLRTEINQRFTDTLVFDISAPEISRG
ncbi:MAG: hypothetical protein FJ042_02155 [Candidatus Cloacimonetes bacterium]|nr:hypothetical protein [Candidatus Cloacimonadota bacterium]